MSPLFSQPNRGYADYQRLDNYDGGVLSSRAATTTNIAVLSSVMDVSRYARLGGFVNEWQAISWWTFQWFADQGATIPIGNRSFVLNTAYDTQANILLTNLGPFCQLIVRSPAAPNFTPQWSLFGSNREHVLEMIPNNPQIVTVTNAPIGAGADIPNTPTDYYAGPARVFAVINNVAGRLDYWMIDPSGIARFVDQWLLPANTDVTVDTVIPPGAVRFDVANTGAATNYYLSVTPTWTGSL